MKLKFIFTVFLWSVVHLVQGQTASDLFVKLPESFLPLNDSERLALINFYKAGEATTLKNRFEDSCSILRLTDEYIQVQTGGNTMELVRLPMVNDSKVIGLIQTVCVPVCDSHLAFYTTGWKKLNTSVFITLADKYDFLKDGINMEDETVTNALIPLDISLMQLRYEPEKQTLEQYYTTPDYLSETEKTKAKPYLKDTPKPFKWNLSRFE
jgi:hypothetical protein